MRYGNIADVTIGKGSLEKPTQVPDWLLRNLEANPGRGVINDERLKKSTLYLLPVVRAKNR